MTASLACAFDCDGTLVDSIGGWRKAELEFAHQCGKELTPEDVDALCTFTLEETGTFYHTKFGLGKSAEDVVAMIDEILISFYTNEVELRPGAGDFVEGLARLGVPLSMVSSSPQRYLRPCLKRVGLSAFFPHVLSVEDMNTSKREPAIFQRAAQLMGADVQHTWGFEDSIYAVRTLVHNDFPCVGVYDRDDSGTFDQLNAEATLTLKTFEGFSAHDFVCFANQR